MEKYMTPEMEIVAFDSEDVITTSGYSECTIEAPVCNNMSFDR